jgi:release factor glutamine methyltransferase
VTVQTALLQGAEILQKAGIADPRLTAEVLLCHAMRRERVYLYAHGGDELTQLAWIHYGRYLNERLKGMPTQYVTHRQEFFGRDFYVNSDVLIPRPETEHLVEAAIAWAAQHKASTILDVGTGSGAIAVTLALELERPVLASDLSLPALTVAERNRRKYDANVRFFAADLLDCVAPASLDLLVSNPPYISQTDSAAMQTEVRDWEPHLALFAGDTGLDVYHRLISQAETVLKPGGRLFLELGYNSLTGVQAMLAAHWIDFAVISDLAGWPRVIGATLAP